MRAHITNTRPLALADTGSRAPTLEFREKGKSS